MNKNNPNEADVFDRIMHLPFFNIFESSYRKHKEILLYLLFGTLSFLISVGTYALLTEIMHINILIANIFAWILSVLFAYITNHIWVFETNARTGKAILQEMGRFAFGRVFSLTVEEILLYVFITVMKLNSMVIKILATITVIILNYIISKKWIFKGSKRAEQQGIQADDKTDDA
ncbi:MAG: GtrA family protein [Clostridiales bacterium]|nr:GtrA family protein [Clostridiales bacterium]